MWMNPVAFYNELGFRVTEYTEDAETGRLWAAWTHRKGGVHDITFTNGKGSRLHHTAFWVPTPLNIIDLLDLMSTTGWLANIERGPGRHGISNAFFLYVRDPDGHRIEIYCSGLPDGRSRSGADQVGSERPAAPDALGCACTEILVRGRQLVCQCAAGRFRVEGTADRRAVMGDLDATRLCRRVVRDGRKSEEIMVKFLSFSTCGGRHYGVLKEDGIVDLSARHGSRWPTLREVIEAGVLAQLAQEGGRACRRCSAFFHHL